MSEPENVLICGGIPATVHFDTMRTWWNQGLVKRTHKLYLEHKVQWVRHPDGSHKKYYPNPESAEAFLMRTLEAERKNLGRTRLAIAVLAMRSGRCEWMIGAFQQGR